MQSLHEPSLTAVDLVALDRRAAMCCERLGPSLDSFLWADSVVSLVQAALVAARQGDAHCHQLAGPATARVRPLRILLGCPADLVLEPSALCHVSP